MRRPEGRHPGNEPDNGFFHLGGFQKFRRFFFGRTADFTDHDNRLRFIITQKHIETINEVCAVHRIATNADTGRLTEPGRVVCATAS